jgi:FdhD protein
MGSRVTIEAAPGRLPSDGAVTAAPVCRVDVGGPSAHTSDLLAVEEPLEIRVGCDVGGRREHRPVSVTMRTPGHDPELAVGYLFTEGVLTRPDQVAAVRRCGRAGGVVRVDLVPGGTFDLSCLDRQSFVSSSCGVCGKTSLAAVRVAAGSRPAPGRPVVDANVVARLPERLRAGQVAFDRTGGLHAAALFSPAGNLLAVREDVGRHNAVDKVIGHEFLAGRVPLADAVLLVSGRASFELVQKAAVAGIPILAAVGAPSSLAVELARECGMTLVGFVRDGRFNIYAGAERVALSPI